MQFKKTQQRGEAASRYSDLDSLRGIEGDSANAYFSVFDNLITLKGKLFSEVTASTAR